MKRGTKHMESYKESLKKIRAEKQITQQQAAEILKVPKRTIENWESGVSCPPDYVQNLILEKLKNF